MNIAIILSGGVGLRLGADIPKQYIIVQNKPILIYSLEKFINNPKIDFIIIALAPEWEEYVSSFLTEINKKVVFSKPGKTREDTIYNSLKMAKKLGGKDDDIVIIHDGVRPLVSETVINDCLYGCQQYEASIATTEVKDTIYVSSYGECITEVPERATLHAGQTPEAFKLGPYLRIHDEASEEEINKVTGGAQFAYQKGLSVFLSKGEDINFKITTPLDLARFEQIIKLSINE